MNPLFLIDTNTCIRFINGRAPQLRTKLLSMKHENIVVCSVVKAEMYYGSMKSQTPEVSLQKQQRFLDQFDSLPFDDAAARQYGAIRAVLEKRGTPISHHDLQIAAIALENNLVLVTHNLREFSRVEGLFLEDWEI